MCHSSFALFKQPPTSFSEGQFLCLVLRKIRIDSNSNLPTEKCFETLSIDKPLLVCERQREKKDIKSAVENTWATACKKQSEKKTTHSQISYMRTQKSSSVNEWMDPFCFFLLLLLFSLLFFWVVAFFLSLSNTFFFLCFGVYSRLVVVTHSLSFSLTIKTIALAIPFGLRDVRLAA